VLICAAPPLSASKPERISSPIDGSVGLRTPSARRCVMPAKPYLKAFLLPGEPGLLRMLPYAKRIVDEPDISSGIR